MSNENLLEDIKNKLIELENESIDSLYNKIYKLINKLPNIDETELDIIKLDEIKDNIYKLNNYKRKDVIIENIINLINDNNIPMIKYYFDLLHEMTDEPRLLTDDEIKEIINLIPIPKSPLEFVALNAHEDIKSNLRLQLYKIMISPSVINNLKGWILNQDLRSQSDSNEPIGLVAAEGIGAPLSQLNFNSFHSAGHGKVYTIDGYREIIKAPVDKKNLTMTIHLKNKEYTFEEVFDLKKDIVGISVADLLLLSDGDIYEKNEYKRPWWYDLYSFFAAEDMEEIIEESKCFMRLKFKINMLYSFKVSLTDIVEKIEINSVKLNNGQPSNEKSVICIPSPADIGIIDIFPVESKQIESLNNYLGKNNVQVGINDSNASSIFLKHFTRTAFKDILLKGIEGIKSIYPIQIKTLDVIKSEEELSSKYTFKTILKKELETINYIPTIEERKEIEFNIKNNDFKLWVDNIALKISGITLEKLEKLLDKCNIKIKGDKKSRSERKKKENLDLPYTISEMPIGWRHTLNNKPGYRDYIIIRMPNGWKDELNKYYDEQMITDAKKSGYGWEYRYRELSNNVEKKFFPSNYIKMLVDKEQDKLSKLAKDNIDNPNWIFQASELSRCFNYVYIETIGSNLKKLLSHKLVNESLTMSNNSHEVLDCFGIESVRAFITRDFYDMINGNGTYLNSMYINLLGSVMTYSGHIVPITSKGAASQQRGILTDMTFQNPLQKANKAASAGLIQSVNSVSASIFQGQRVKLGTGGVEMVLNIESLKKFLKGNYENNDDNDEDFENALDSAYNDISPGDLTSSYQLMDGENEYDDVKKENATTEKPQLDILINRIPYQQIPKVSYSIPFLDLILANLKQYDNSLEYLNNLTIVDIINSFKTKKKQPIKYPIDPSNFIKEMTKK